MLIEMTDAHEESKKPKTKQTDRNRVTKHLLSVHPIAGTMLGTKNEP